MTTYDTYHGSSWVAFAVGTIIGRLVLSELMTGEASVAGGKKHRRIERPVAYLAMLSLHAGLTVMFFVVGVIRWLRQ
jgi:hypothetical protein